MKPDQDILNNIDVEIEELEEKLSELHYKKEELDIEIADAEAALRELRESKANYLLECKRNSVF